MSVRAIYCGLACSLVLGLGLPMHSLATDVSSVYRGTEVPADQTASLSNLAGDFVILDTSQGHDSRLAERLSFLPGAIIVENHSIGIAMAYVGPLGPTNNLASLKQVLDTSVAFTMFSPSLLQPSSRAPGWNGRALTDATHVMVVGGIQLRRIEPEIILQEELSAVPVPGSLPTMATALSGLVVAWRR